ncbi:50S ribosomal protein L17 [Candidatus Fermentibacteria bacterium]|nr:50S ribosomal protein L17 [Candidatus Fermentibacteria bacterium]
MRHRKTGRKLGRTAAHRRALKRHLAEALFRHERITTTLAKAKEMRPYVEHLISLSRNDTVHARRIFGRDIQDRELIRQVFSQIGPRFVSRPGGYTRVIRLGTRTGDGAQMAILELVEKKGPATKTEGATKTA